MLDLDISNISKDESIEAPEAFRMLAEYYLRELLGENIIFLDIELVSQNISINDEKLEELLAIDDIKLQSEIPFYTLFPIFKSTKYTKELDRKYWRLLKKGKLPTDFSNSNREDVLYWLGPCCREEFELESTEELRESLSEMNKEINDDEDEDVD